METVQALSLFLMFDQLLLRQAGDHVAEDGIAIAVVFSVNLMATGVCFYSSFWYKCEDFENPDLKDTELLNTQNSGKQNEKAARLNI